MSSPTVGLSHPTKSMTPNEFLEYINYFSSQKYDDYYTDDIILSLPSLPDLVGKQAIKEFFAHQNKFLHETVRVIKMLSEGDGLMAHVVSDFYCINDWPDSHLGPMKKGDLRRVEILLLCKLRDGRFCLARTSRLKPLGQ